MSWPRFKAARKLARAEKLSRTDGQVLMELCLLSRSSATDGAVTVRIPDLAESPGVNVTERSVITSLENLRRLELIQTDVGKGRAKSTHYINLVKLDPYLDGPSHAVEVKSFHHKESHDEAVEVKSLHHNGGRAVVKSDHPRGETISPLNGSHFTTTAPLIDRSSVQRSVRTQPDKNVQTDRGTSTDLASTRSSFSEQRLHRMCSELFSKRQTPRQAQLLAALGELLTAGRFRTPAGLDLPALVEWAIDYAAELAEVASFRRALVRPVVERFIVGQVGTPVVQHAANVAR
ncbi:MAG: hypothetical protein EHM13_08345 [Acidobacteria bacterium]|nr:MAG: hypothetical protein EHM13_08345 [Acidobacteriota bacterium]